MPITTKLVSSNCEVYSIQHYVITFVSDLRQVGGFLRYRGIRIPAPIKTDGHDIADILLKVALSTINHYFIQYHFFFFQVFFALHFLCVPFWILLIFHCKHFWMWIIFPGTIFLAEQIYRIKWIKQLRYGVTYIEKVTLLPCGVSKCCQSQE